MQLCCSPVLTLSPTGNMICGRNTVVLTLPYIYGLGGREAGNEVSQAMSLLASLSFWRGGAWTDNWVCAHLQWKGPISGFHFSLAFAHSRTWKRSPHNTGDSNSCGSLCIEIMFCSLGSKICFSKLIFPQATRTWAHGPCLLLHL